MKLDRGQFCPLIGKDCIKLECSWFTQIRGKHPQTGEDVDEWGCAIAWMPILLIENTQQQRQAGSAMESFRNETVKANRENQQIYMEGLRRGIIPTAKPLDIPINIEEDTKE